jgi:FixJ family two-component response regulator
LFASRRAVESRRSRLMRKLDVATLPDLIRFGIEVGLHKTAV